MWNNELAALCWILVKVFIPLWYYILVRILTLMVSFFILNFRCHLFFLNTWISLLWNVYDCREIEGYQKLRLFLLCFIAVWLGCMNFNIREIFIHFDWTYIGHLKFVLKYVSWTFFLLYGLIDHSLRRYVCWIFFCKLEKKLTGQVFNHGELGGVMSSHTKALV